MKTFTDYCKDFIIENIDEHEGRTTYAEEIGYMITERINIDGSAEYSTYNAIEYLKSWWYDCADYINYEKDNFGELAHNPFEEPEAFHVCMITAGVNNLLYQRDIISENCNEEIKLTPQIIERIKDEVQDKEIQL